MTANFWPNLNVNRCNIPYPIQQAIDSFYQFYNQYFPKRILQWCFHDSIAEIQGHFQQQNINKSYIFIVNTFQAVILLYFNIIKYNEVTFEQLQSYCQMTDNDLKQSLITLITSKLIVKTNTGYILNNKLNYASKRLKLVNIPKNEDIIRKEKIEDDRSFAIEATIVRVMKSTQRIHHNELINRILQQLENFKVKISVIILI